MQSGTDVSLLIEAYMAELHLPSEIRKGNKNEPIGIKLVLGCGLPGGSNKKILNSNRIWVCESSINDSFNSFWHIEFYGTSKENPP